MSGKPQNVGRRAKVEEVWFRNHSNRCNFVLDIIKTIYGTDSEQNLD